MRGALWHEAQLVRDEWEKAHERVVRWQVAQLPERCPDGRLWQRAQLAPGFGCLKAHVTPVRWQEVQDPDRWPEGRRWQEVHVLLEPGWTNVQRLPGRWHRVHAALE